MTSRSVPALRATTHRRLGVLAAALFFAGCAAPAQQSQVPSDTTAATPSASATSSVPETPTSSPAPSRGAASDEPLEGFVWNDILRVEVSGLAVRILPYTDLPLATGYVRDGDGWRKIDEVRLNAGDFVSVDLGPLQIGDTTWYRVWPAEGGQLHSSSVAWDTKNNGPNPVEPGWVAAAVGADVYLTVHEAFEYDRVAIGLPPPLFVSGSGDLLSEPLEGFDLFGLDWVYLIDGQNAPCHFTVTLEPVEGGQSVVAVERALIGAFEEDYVSLGAADRTPVVGDGFEPFHVRVTSGCEWSLRLEYLAHD